MQYKYVYSIESSVDIFKICFQTSDFTFVYLRIFQYSRRLVSLRSIYISQRLHIYRFKQSILKCCVTEETTWPLFVFHLGNVSTFN
jgi:hypothetical protein